MVVARFLDRINAETSFKGTRESGEGRITVVMIRAADTRRVYLPRLEDLPETRGMESSDNGGPVYTSVFQSEHLGKEES